MLIELAIEMWIFGVIVGSGATLLILRKRRQPKREAKTCMCGHGNHVHEGATEGCQVSYGISEKFPHGANCACSVFVEKKAPVDEIAKELERMVKLR